MHFSMFALFKRQKQDQGVLRGGHCAAKQPRSYRWGGSSVLRGVNLHVGGRVRAGKSMAMSLYVLPRMPI